MKFITLFFLLSAGSLITAAQNNIYGISIDSAAGNKPILLSQFAGKKILIVNTASKDVKGNQYEELKALQHLYKRSLVVIAIPSNSFNSESNSDSVALVFYSQKGYDKSFAVNKKLIVVGQSIDPLYKWLTQKRLNGQFDSNVKGAFQKYLINEKGILVGVFAPSVHPLSMQVRNVLDQ